MKSSFMGDLDKKKGEARAFPFLIIRTFALFEQTSMLNQASAFSITTLPL